jgi:hypothetical protein
MKETATIVRTWMANNELKINDEWGHADYT